jgi:hypothetical protein
MAETDLPNLPALIGTERFSTFLSAAGGSHEAAVRLYSWNMDASASLWGDLHVLEIVLRNGLHHRLARLFNRPDWWNADVLRGRDRRPVDDAIAAIRRRHPRGWTAGQVVAELGFGFWIGLLAHHCGRPRFARCSHISRAGEATSTPRWSASASCETGSPTTSRSSAVIWPTTAA